MELPGKFYDDLPADPRHQLDDDRIDLATQLGLPPLTEPDIRACSNAIVLTLLNADRLSCTGVRYSRDKNRYGQSRFGHPRWWSRENVCTAVSHLARAGSAIFHQQAPQRNPLHLEGPALQSRLEALSDFFQSALAAHIDDLPATPLDRVICRDRNGDPMPLVDHPRVTATHAFCEQYDPAVAAADLQLRHRSVKLGSGGVFFLTSSDGRRRRMSFQRRYPTRIFSENLDHGGRLYRTCWSMIGEDLRSTIQINGIPVREHDLHACHLGLAYLSVGIERPTSHNGELYDLPGNHNFSRRNIKFGVQIMFNARTRRGAVGAMAAELQRACPGTQHKEHLNRADELYLRIAERYPELERLWGTGAGLVFQCVDSEIICHVLLLLLENHGALGLSVHDSVIVQEQHFNVLKQLMDDAFFDVGGRLAPELIANHLTLRQFKPRSPRSSERSSPATSSSLSQSDLKKIRLWSEGKLPTIVAVSVGRPWELCGMSSTAWHSSTPEKIQRQIAAYRALLDRSDVDELANVAKRLGRYRVLRQHACPTDRLPVDDLLEQLADLAASARRRNGT